MKDKQIIFRNTKQHYTMSARGYPVVFIHGFAEDSAIWNNQADYLKNIFRLIIPDLPGSGMSEGIRHEPTVIAEKNEPGSTGMPAATMEEYADCIKAILESEQIDRCIMIGHSLGGYITLAFAERYPGMLQAFGLFHSTAYADSEEKKAARRKSIEFIRKHGSGEFIRQSLPGLFSGNFKEQCPEIILELIERYDNFNPDSLVSYYEAMIQRPDRTSVLQSFSSPILFIIGEKDNAVPLEHSLQQSHIPELSYIHILENAAHMGMLEMPGEINKLLLSFIKKVVT